MGTTVLKYSLVFYNKETDLKALGPISITIMTQRLTAIVNKDTENAATSIAVDKGVNFKSSLFVTLLLLVELFCKKEVRKFLKLQALKP